ncbi:MAG TPA: CBS domain-containing protein [Desulfobacteraceae bacterium]|nr:CBS domain-containing protein [Desulfobacteraceae bacterium]
MKAKKVTDFMIPLSDYATISQEATLAQAIKALKTSREESDLNHKHRAVLALDANDNVVGKLSMRDVLKSLEPKYRQFEHKEDAGSIGLSRFGFNMEFLSSLVDKLELWDESMEELVKKASRRRVKEIMYTPSKGEYVPHDAPMAEAVHQFILGCHQSLLVLDGDVVIGVLRLADIFDLVCDLVE